MSMTIRQKNAAAERARYRRNRRAILAKRAEARAGRRDELAAIERARYHAHDGAERKREQRAQRLLTPLDHLWFDTRDVLAHLRSSLGPAWRETADAAGLDGLIYGLTRRTHCRFAVADDVCVRLGLHVDSIGEPIVSAGAPSNPQRKAAA